MRRCFNITTVGTNSSSLYRVVSKSSLPDYKVHPIVKLKKVNRLIYFSELPIIILGALNWRQNETSQQRIQAAAQFKHENSDPLFYNNDIGLIKLAKPAIATGKYILRATNSDKSSIKKSA